MAIGIIGSGMIGVQVAGLCIAAGLEVVICNTRGPETLADLVAELGPGARAATVAGVAKAAELIVLAVPFGSYGRIPADLLAGKIVIDTTNYYPQRDGWMREVTTDTVATSELVQRHLARSFVVRAINNMDFASLGRAARPAGAPDRSALPVGSDHARPKAAVVEFLDRIGFDAVDMGTLAESWRSEPTTPVYVSPYYTGPVGKSEVARLLRKAVRHDRMFG